MAEQPQPWQSPRDDWDQLEQAISNDRPELLADLTGSNEDWQLARTEINAVIAASVTAWWEMIFRFWIQGAAGQFGKQHSTAINPNI